MPYMKRLIVLMILLNVLTKVLADGAFFSYFKSNDSQQTESVLIFYRPTCPYCQQMEEALLNDTVLQNEMKSSFNVQTININTPEGQQIAKLFQVSKVPVIIKYNEHTQATSLLNGFGSAERLAGFLGLSLNNQSLSPLKSGASVCGNSVKEGTEQCDDGNSINTDDCSNTCQWTHPSVCGDGIKEQDEQCDDGNMANADGCSSTCQLTVQPVCGNMVVEETEQCDDGNMANADGCSSSLSIDSATCVWKHGCGRNGAV